MYKSYTFELYLRNIAKICNKSFTKKAKICHFPNKLRLGGQGAFDRSRSDCQLIDRDRMRLPTLIRTH